MHSAFPGASPFDTVVFGAGYAGFAAALACHRAGRRTLLVDRRAAVLAESGWAFALETGTSVDPLWLEWRARIERRAASPEGAIAEVLAVDLLAAESIPMLFYAAPVSCDRLDDGCLAAVTVATKGGLRRLHARQWIDATDGGELACLLEPGWSAPAPQAQALNLCFRRPDTTPRPPLEWFEPGDVSFTWAAGSWPNEQVLSIRRRGRFVQPRAHWIPALRALHAIATDDLRGAVLTHGSVIPFSMFTEREITPHRGLPGNTCYCGGSGTTLAEKFGAGLQAARLLTALPRAEIDRDIAPISAPLIQVRQVRCDVGVAGLGTGGALAAIAAARRGARVVAFEAMPFPGGVGTGAGIHFYYFGVKGGLQEELDTRVRAIMPFFGTPSQVGGFHPEAKKLVLDSLLAEAGVTSVYDAIIHGSRQSGGTVTALDIAAMDGPCEARAAVWIDATGDGDLAARAGADFRLGRQGDGLLHAFGQSCGRAHIANGVARLHIVNSDAGFCDPTDEHDLTRARLAGVLQYVQEYYDAEVRPTYIAPAVGVRQSRHIATDYTLTLDDLINRQRFPDAIGYTGCHYDNHARDYEFETDEAAFWVWVCQQWYGRLASEIPFRILLPTGLDNVILGCRAAGVSEEAHHSFRMQRDMQRIGEAAGIAAALAARKKGRIRHIAMVELQEALVESGALRIEDLPDQAFGHHAGPDYFGRAQGEVDTWLAELSGGPATEALWHLYRAETLARPRVEALLSDADPAVTWRSAAILAMWCDERAEPRLLHAIRTREDDRSRDITKPQQAWFYMPRWYAALTLLKRCLTTRSLDLLESMSASPDLELNVRCAVALAFEAAARRHPLAENERGRIERALQVLLQTAAPHAIRSPQGSPLGEVEPPPIPQPTDLRPVVEDFTWQLHLAVLRARLALGLPPQPQARTYANDKRATVRRRFSSLLSAAPVLAPAGAS